ncbi:MAG: BsaWI family type II restriction enzyme [bacterium]|nr:BsaWI family type II restriction enzyme [bacterium]
MPNNYETNSQRQRYVQKSGRAWEHFVRDKVNQDLLYLRSKLKVIRGDDARNDNNLWKKLSIPVGKINSNQRIWGDIDLVVVDENNNPIAIISCKTSLHGRLSESLFYAVVLKDMISSLKFVFSTPDKGRQQSGGSWQSEWGSEESPTKDRQLGSHYTDGIYIENNKTKLGGKLKALSSLAKDLVDWHSNKLD